MKKQLVVTLSLLLMLMYGSACWAQGTKWSAYGPLAADTVANDDTFLILDVSDTSLGATGTQKQYTWETLIADLGTDFARSLGGTGFIVDADGDVTCKSLAVTASTTPGFWGLDSEAPGTDKDVGNIQWNYIDGADGSENADFWIATTQGGTEDTQILLFDESDDRWEVLKALSIGPETPDDNNLTFAVRGDADSDAGGDTTDVFQIALTTNATPTSARWAFTSTQSAGYSFDKGVIFGADPTIQAADPDLIFNDTDGADASIQAEAIDADDSRLQLQPNDSAGRTTYLECDGGTETVDILKPAVFTSSATADSVIANSFDATGAVDMDYGSGDITDHTFTTDDCTVIVDGGITVSTGDTITLGSTAWNSGDSIDGEAIAADTIDDDSIDFADVTCADVTMSDCGAVTSSGAVTADSVVANLFDATGAVDMDYGSADITDHTFITDGGVDSITIGNNADLDFGITIDSDTNDFTLNWDEDNAELELTSVGDEDLVIDLDTATDQEVGISSSTGVTQINLGSLNMVTTGAITGAVGVITDADGITLSAAQGYGYFVLETGAGDVDLPDVCDSATGANVCVMTRDASELVSIAVDSGDANQDTIVASGLSLSVSEELDLGQVALDFACLACLEANKWYVIGSRGTLADGGAAD